ncbi:MAG TPA: phage late control D family protein, partial [Limnobacter sp.]|nr:phage late control D family protein [Limnobacter sp.]
MNRLIGLSGTAPLDQVYFRSARLLESLSDHSAATVYLESDVEWLKPDDFLGQSLCLCFETRNQNCRYFDGVVVEMAQESISIGGRCTYRLELKSWTWLLGRNRDYRVYQHQCIHDILAEIAGRYSHSSIRFADRTVGPRHVREYMVQFGESDADFLLRILEQEGVYFYFEHAQNQHTLVLVDSATAHAAFPDYESLDHDPAHAGLRLTPEEKITSLWFAKSITAPRHAHSDYNFKTPASALLGESSGKADPFNSPYEIFEYPGEFSQQGEGQ